MAPPLSPSFSKAMRERERCLALVRHYRQSIERKEGVHPSKSARDLAIVSAVLKSLLDIEENIANPAISEKKKILPGDFSIEEMELAERIIQEQSHNPFEG